MKNARVTTPAADYRIGVPRKVKTKLFAPTALAFAPLPHPMEGMTPFPGVNASRLFLQRTITHPQVHH